MRRLTFQLRIFEEHYGVEAGFFQFVHSIVDNVIGNDISADWDYQKGRPISVGMLHRDGVEIFMAESEDDNDFRVLVIDKLEQVGENSLFYSFNKNMEQGNFTGAFDLLIPIGEIKPFKAKGWTRDKFFQALIDHKQIPDVKIFDPFKGDAKQCVTEWQAYLVDKDNQHLTRIGFHNLANLLKEVCIIKHMDFFLAHWEIDNNGFMVGEKP